MKIYLATAGEYSDFHVVRAFTHREDAEAYELADDVEEMELLDRPAEVVDYHRLWWFPEGDTGSRWRTENPSSNTERVDASLYPTRAKHTWQTVRRGVLRLFIEGYDLEAVRKVYSEQRAQYIALKDAGIEDVLS